MFKNVRKDFENILAIFGILWHISIEKSISEWAQEQKTQNKLSIFPGGPSQLFQNFLGVWGVEGGLYASLILYNFSFFGISFHLNFELSEFN